MIGRRPFVRSFVRPPSRHQGNLAVSRRGSTRCAGEAKKAASMTCVRCDGGGDGGGGKEDVSCIVYLEIYEPASECRERQTSIRASFERERI